MKRVYVSCFVALAMIGVSAGPALAAPALSLGAPALSAPLPHAPAGRSDLLKLLTVPVAFGITIRKDTAAIGAKFVQRAGQATKDYTDGVGQAGQEWEARTKEGEGNYEQGVQQAIADKRFGKGVSEAGAAKYTNNAVKLGGTRYQPGVANAQDAYVRGVNPYLDVLRNLALPPKGPRRSPQNQARANAVALALGNRRVNR